MSLDSTEEDKLLKIAVRTDVHVEILDKGDISTTFSTKRFNKLNLQIDDKIFNIRDCSRYDPYYGIEYQLVGDPPDSLYQKGEELPSKGDIVKLTTTIDYSTKEHIIDELPIKKTQIPHRGLSWHRDYCGYSLVLQFKPDATIEPGIALRFQVDVDILVFHNLSISGAFREQFHIRVDNSPPEHCTFIQIPI